MLPSVDTVLTAGWSTPRLGLPHQHRQTILVLSLPQWAPPRTGPLGHPSVRCTTPRACRGGGITLQALLCDFLTAS